MSFMLSKRKVSYAKGKDHETEHPCLFSANTENEFNSTEYVSCRVIKW
jgi:hypothetical protein